MHDSEDREGTIHWVSNRPGESGEERDRLIAERESLILKASKHVIAAQKQRELANEKRKEAFDDRDKVMGEPCITLVADFAQNAYVPNMCSEQPGETYYMSPVNAYIFGVADCSNKPTTLTAHCFMEGEAVKGGNTVASLLWKECGRLGLIPVRHPVTGKILSRGHQPAKEVNIIMDNCIGQNKNNMVLRLLFFMVSRKLCRVARAIFLVKGHTKNDCDRLFNLMKIDYRKENVYTPEDLLLCIARQGDVSPIAIVPGDILLWDVLLQEEYMPKLKIGVQENHVYTVSQDDPEKLTVNAWDGQAATQQFLVKAAYRGNQEWYLKDPEAATAPGLQYINKWKEMNDKWRPLVPQHKWKEWKYFNEDIAVDKRKEVTDHTAASKKQRKGRTRIADTTMEEEEDGSKNTSSTAAV